MNRSNSSPRLASQGNGNVTPPVLQPAPMIRNSSTPLPSTTSSSTTATNSHTPQQQPPVKRSTGGVLGSNGLRPLTSANPNSASTSALNKTRPGGPPLKRTSSKVAVQAYADGIVGRGMGGCAPMKKKIGGGDEETSSEEEEDEEEDFGILRRRNTFDGAISSIVAADEGWDSDYHGHGCEWGFFFLLWFVGLGVRDEEKRELTFFSFFLFVRSFVQSKIDLNQPSSSIYLPTYLPTYLTLSFFSLFVRSFGSISTSDYIFLPLLSSSSSSLSLPIRSAASPVVLPSLPLTDFPLPTSTQTHHSILDSFSYPLCIIIFLFFLFSDLHMPSSYFRYRSFFSQTQPNQTSLHFFHPFRSFSLSRLFRSFSFLFSSFLVSGSFSFSFSLILCVSIRFSDSIVFSRKAHEGERERDEEESSGREREGGDRDETDGRTRAKHAWVGWIA